MIRHFALIASIPLLLSVVGCYTLFEVNSDPTKKLDGLPFYKVIGVKQKTTTYARTWIQLKLDGIEEQITIGTDGKPILRERSMGSARINVPEGQYHPVLLAAAVNAAANKIAKDGATFEDSLIEFVASLRKEDAEHPPMRILSSQEINVDSSVETASTKFLSQHLVSNELNIVTVVDYEHTLYFDVWVPLFGSGSGVFKPKGDGTISEAEGKTDGSSLAEPLPLADFFTKALGLGDIQTAEATTSDTSQVLKRQQLIKGMQQLPGQVSGPIPTKITTRKFVQVTPTVQGYVYRVTRSYSINDTTVDHSPLSLDIKAGSVLRSALGGGTQSPKGADSSEKKLTFEGHIGLPKDGL